VDSVDVTEEGGKVEFEVEREERRVVRPVLTSGGEREWDLVVIVGRRS